MGGGSSKGAPPQGAEVVLAAAKFRHVTQSSKKQNANNQDASVLPHEVTEVTAVTPRAVEGQEIKQDDDSYATGAGLPVHKEDGHAKGQSEVLEVQSLDDDDMSTATSKNLGPAKKAAEDPKVPKKRRKEKRKEKSMEDSSEIELLRMVMMKERSGKGNEPDTARVLLHLVARWCDKGKYMEAEPQLERAVGILEASLGATHHETQAAQSSLKAVYRRNGKAPMGDNKETTAVMVHMQLEREKQAQRQNEHAAAVRTGSSAIAIVKDIDREREANKRPAMADSKEGYRDPAWPYATTLKRGGVKLKGMTHLQLLQMLIAKEKCGTGDDSDTARILSHLAAQLLKKGKTVEAEQMLVRAVKIFVKVPK